MPDSASSKPPPKSDLTEAALQYHRFPTPGKLSVVAKKPLANQRDLALAYSPGVAAACEAIVADPGEVDTVTGRANLVAVVTNGTAVLGLGAIGPLAAKPVMEGKAVLFKKFANIDVFDIEIAENDPDKLVDIIASLEPTFGAINLEDIKAPDCFIVESKLRARMKIPVFHDDQHGTAIVVAAAVINGLSLLKKDIAKVKLVSTGGGAAGIACLNQLLALGLRRENVILVDQFGVVFKGRNQDMTAQKADYAVDTKARTLAEAIVGADVFLGLSAPRVLTQDMVRAMAKPPFILALANPEPEITPALAREAAPDAIIATGRSDYPNQVNNVLCFPYIFRGALDVGATTINDAMKTACVEAIARLARGASSDVVSAAYGGDKLQFGADYLIPKPFDPRLVSEIAPAVAKAAMDSGVATRPIADLVAYKEHLQQFVYRSAFVMKPVFDQARAHPKRVTFAEGEDERVLFAVKALLDDGIAVPIVVGRPTVIAHRSQKLSLGLVPGEHFRVINPEEDARYGDYWRHFHQVMERKGVSPDTARTIVRTNATVIASLMVAKGDADAMICGTFGEYPWHLRYITDVLGLSPGMHKTSALSLLVLDSGPVFICDTFVAEDPSAEDIAHPAQLAADKVSDFGITPKVALLATSNFGARPSAASRKMRRALKLITHERPALEVEGEMQADVALDAVLRSRIFPNSRLKGAANLLIMPTLEAANIAFNLVRTLANGLHVGPILLGIAKPAHITTTSVTARGLVNLAALAVIDAQMQEEALIHPRVSKVLRRCPSGRGDLFSAPGYACGAAWAPRPRSIAAIVMSRRPSIRSRSTPSTRIVIVADLFEGLLAPNAEGRPTLGVADSWSVSADGLRYTFHVREGLAWSDGSVLRCRDAPVVASFRHLMDPKTAARFAQLMYVIKNARAVNTGKTAPEALGVSAPDVNTVVIELEALRRQYFPELLDRSPGRHRARRVGWKLPWATAGPSRGR